MQAQRSPLMAGGGGAAAAAAGAAVGMPSQGTVTVRRRCEGTAMGAITLDLRPGLGVGPFTLGMPISDAFAQIERQPNIYDVVHVKYFDEEPLKLDFVISFPDHGFHLRFDPWSQRLRLVEIYDVKRLQLRYATALIGGPSTLATFAAVYALFGPTFPGIYDKERGIYTLFYPGLSFAFPIPSQYTNLFTNGEVADLPLEFPDGTTPVTCRVCIYDSSTDSKVGVGSLMDKAVVPALPAGSLYMEEVHAKLGEELWFTIGGQHIPFGASPQDVWTDLGRPCGIHQKQVDQMVIHSASEPRPRTTLCGDYFYNYFSRGIDILFDGQTHRIKKFVLHTNFPGHSDFNSYKKCNFVIYDAEAEDTCQPGNVSKNCITPSTKWEQVKEILGDCGRAAIQTQGSMNNPFGSTFVYGYQNIAFEVMKNGYIATVTLFQS
ncbi:PHAF1 protein At3g51130-like [Miscanthus floridulus]|uniref:PHAF1 protein At3g51130-like n=1 Tax=Miscanthus floridulus TaxID=154761 RepID=UPI003457F254